MIIFRKTIPISQNTPARISIGPFVTEKRPFKKLKNKSILARYIFEKKGFHTFKFHEVNISSEVCHIWKFELSD